MLWTGIPRPGAHAFQVRFALVAVRQELPCPLITLGYRLVQPLVTSLASAIGFVLTHEQYRKLGRGGGASVCWLLQGLVLSLLPSLFTRDAADPEHHEQGSVTLSRLLPPRGQVDEVDECCDFSLQKCCDFSSRGDRRVAEFSTRSCFFLQLWCPDSYSITPTDGEHPNVAGDSFGGMLPPAELAHLPNSGRLSTYLGFRPHQAFTCKTHTPPPAGCDAGDPRITHPLCCCCCCYCFRAREWWRFSGGTRERLRRCYSARAGRRRPSSPTRPWPVA